VGGFAGEATPILPALTNDETILIGIQAQPLAFEWCLVRKSRGLSSHPVDKSKSHSAETVTMAAITKRNAPEIGERTWNGTIANHQLGILALPTEIAFEPFTTHPKTSKEKHKLNGMSRCRLRDALAVVENSLYDRYECNGCGVKLGARVESLHVANYPVSVCLVFPPRLPYPVVTTQNCFFPVVYFYICCNNRTCRNYMVIVV